MSKGELIDSHVSLKQCKQAVEALHSHELKKQEKFEENQLLPGKEQHVWLNVTVKKIPSGHRLKPIKIPIIHPLVDPRISRVCLITKDPQREYKDLLETHNIKFISRVVGIEKLKGKFKPYEARRVLLKENDLFLADERVIPLLPKLLGSKWFEAKKQPIPVCLTRKDLKSELERAISSTYMNQNQGTCTSIKVGKMSQKPSQILENIRTAIPTIAKAIKDGWDNIQSLHIKTNSSVSLPIWSCTLDDTEGGRWNGLLAKSDEEMEDEAEESASEDDSDEEEEVKVVKGKSKDSTGKGRKRASSSDEDDSEDEQPRKKAKATEGAPHAKSKTPTASKSRKFAAITDVDGGAKARKQKSDKLTSTSPKVVTPSNEIISTGKKSKKLDDSALTSRTKALNISEGKEKKKSKASVLALVPNVSSPVLDTPANKNKKSHVESDISSTQKRAYSPPAPATAPRSPTKDKSRHEKKTKITSTISVATPLAPEISVKSSISKEEMKRKRSAGAGEKKKLIIAKSKGGKSAKNAVLGKKIAQG